MDCSGATIVGPYSYTSPTFAPIGTLLPVTCTSGFVWSSAPTSGAHNAICSNVSNSGQWVFSGSCVGALFRGMKNVSIVCFIINIIVWSHAVDCSTATLSGLYAYNVPSPAGQGTAMNVSCQSGFAWTSSPYNSVHSATCANVSNSGLWLISGNASCVGMRIVDIWMWGHLSFVALILRYCASKLNSRGVLTSESRRRSHYTLRYAAFGKIRKVLLSVVK